MTETDAGGNLTLHRGSEKDDLRAWVSLDGAWVALCRLSGSGDTDLGELRLEANACVRGRVTDIDGAPAAGVPILVSPRLLVGETDELFLRTVHTDHGGHFEVRGLLPGPCGIAVYSERGRLRVANVDAGPDGDPLLLALEQADVIRGEVREQTGEAVAGVAVNGTPQDEAVASKLFDCLGATVVTDTSGSFALPCVQAGRSWRLHAATLAAPFGHGFADAVASGADGIRIVLRRR